MLNKKTYLINLKNTSKNEINENWIEHYENSLDSVNNFWYRLFIKHGCPCCGSKDKKIVGAHVGHMWGNDRAPYIVPICQTCNISRTVVIVPKLLPLVPVPLDSPHYNDIVYPKNVEELHLDSFFRN